MLMLYSHGYKYSPFFAYSLIGMHYEYISCISFISVEATMNFELSSYTVTEGAQVSLTVLLSNPSSTEVSATLATSDFTAFGIGYLYVLYGGSWSPDLVGHRL